MVVTLPPPRVAFGAGAPAALPAQLAGLGVTRPLLLSDRGLERAGVVAAASRNRTSPYRPTRDEYHLAATALLS